MNIGFLGCSNIAKKAIEALNTIEGVVLYGCSAQSFDRAKKFQEKYCIKKSYATHEEMLLDSKIDLVYVSTLPESHFKDTMLTLKHNKSVIVEKPIATKIEEVDEILLYSEKHNLYVTEAVIGRYHPARLKIDELISNLQIGNPYNLEANYSLPIKEVDKNKKIKIDGEILCDLGIFPIDFCTMFFGYSIKEICSVRTIDRENKFDLNNSINIVYKDGKMANLYVSSYGLSNKKSYIYGTLGFIEVDNFHNPKVVKLYRNISESDSTLIASFLFEDSVNGYEYEFKKAINEIKNKQIESDCYTHYQVKKNYEILDKIDKNSLKVEI